MSITSLLAISLGAILTNNFIFAQFLGICPFLGVSKKSDTAIGMGLAVTFVMGIASAVCFGVNKLLIALDLGVLFLLLLVVLWRRLSRTQRLLGVLGRSWVLPCSLTAACTLFSLVGICTFACLRSGLLR